MRNKYFLINNYKLAAIVLLYRSFFLIVKQVINNKTVFLNVACIIKIHAKKDKTEMLIPFTDT